MENLHRCDLTKDQRDEHFRRYAQFLTERREVWRQIDAKPKSGAQGGRPVGVAAEIASATGLSKRTVERALNPTPPRPQLVEVKDAFDVVIDQVGRLASGSPIHLSRVSLTR